MDTMGKIYLTDTLASFLNFQFFSGYEFLNFWHITWLNRFEIEIPVVIDGRWQGVLFIAIHRHS